MEIIQQMKEHKVYIPYDSLSCYINDSLLVHPLCEDAPFKMIVYSDTSQCSTCYLKSLYHWKDFVESKYSLNGNLSFIFIVGTRNGDARLVRNNLFRTELEYPIYIDDKNAFISANPSIPKEHTYHTFLIDQNDSILLVGNPLFNVKIEKMLLDILDEKLADGGER